MMDPAIYQALALAKGLELYHRTGLRPNTQWTLSAMLATAGRITGKGYNYRIRVRGKPSEALRAANDLREWVQDYAKGQGND